MSTATDDFMTNPLASGDSQAGDSPRPNQTRPTSPKPNARDGPLSPRREGSSSPARALSGVAGSVLKGINLRRSVKPEELTPADLFLDSQFVVRVALYCVGVMLIHLGIFSGAADIAWGMATPGLGFIGGWFMIECRVNSVSEDRDRWSKGNSGGTFFFGLGILSALIGVLRVGRDCPNFGSENLSSFNAHLSETTHLVTMNQLNESNAVGDGANTMATFGTREREREALDEAARAEQGCILGRALGGVSAVLMATSLAVFILDQFDRMVKKAEVQAVGHAAIDDEDDSTDFPESFEVEGGYALPRPSS